MSSTSISDSTRRLPVSSDSSRATSSLSASRRSATRCRIAARSGAGCPARALVEGPARGADRVQGVLRSGLGDRGDHAPVRGTADLPGSSVAGVSPAPVDEQLRHAFLPSGPRLHRVDASTAMGRDEQRWCRRRGSRGSFPRHSGTEPAGLVIWVTPPGSPRCPGTGRPQERGTGARSAPPGSGSPVQPPVQPRRQLRQHEVGHDRRHHHGRQERSRDHGQVGATTPSSALIARLSGKNAVQIITACFQRGGAPGSAGGPRRRAPAAGRTSPRCRYGARGATPHQPLRRPEPPRPLLRRLPPGQRLRAVEAVEHVPLVRPAARADPAGPRNPGTAPPATCPPGPRRSSARCAPGRRGG